MKSFTRYALILVALILPLVISAETASQLLNKTADKFRKAQSLEVKYTISSQQGSFTGSGILAGETFNIKTPRNEIIYDGKTLWNYSADNQDVYVSEPTADELQQVNPFAIINVFRTLYKAQHVKTAETGKKKILLTANSANADIKKALITINASTLYPETIVLTPASGPVVTIKVTSLKAGKKLPISTFRFDNKLHKGVEVVDLR